MACSTGFGVDGVTLQPGDHICGLFYGWLDRDKLLVPFFRTGLRAGDRCVVVTDRTDPTPILRQLGPEADTDQWLASGQLQLWTSNQQPDTPTDLGHDEMLAIWQQSVTTETTASSSSRFLRIGGEVSWWTPTASPAGLARYEAELDRHIGDDMAVLCLYDLSRFCPDVVINAVVTHRVVVVGDRVVDNPWYVPPDHLPTIEGDHTSGPPRPTVRDISNLVNAGQLTHERHR